MLTEKIHSSPPGQNVNHFADDTFKSIFMIENLCIFIWMTTLKFVPKILIDNKSALIQVMAWRREGDKPLPEPMMTQFIDAYMHHLGEMS